MNPRFHNNTSIKNLIEMREIKNFKTQKFKHRMKDQLSSYSQIHFHHRHHPIQYNSTTNFNCLQIYKVTPSPSVLSDISFVQIASSLQLSVVSTSCFKMSITIVLLLLIASSHIANCQAILERDNSLIFLSKNNNLSEHLLQYIRSKDNVMNKRLIVDRKSTINNKILKNEGEEALKLIKYPLEQTKVFKTINIIDKWWSNISQQIHKKDDDYENFGQGGSNNNNITGEKTLHQNNLISGELNKIVTPNEVEFNRIPLRNSSTNFMGSNDEELLQIVMEGLGLQKLPDFNKANISQMEYSTKYNEYLDRIRERNLLELQTLDNSLDSLDYEDSNTSLSLISISHNSSEAKQYRQRRSLSKERSSPNRTILLKFPLNIESELEASDIEEANIRFLLITSPALATSGQSKRRHRIRAHRGKIPNRKSHLLEPNQNNSTSKQKNKNFQDKQQKHILNMKVYQLLEPKGRVWIDGRKIEIKTDRKKMDETTSQWLQFDVTKAVEGWLINKQRNLGLEIQCDNCFRNGARIIDDLSGDSEEDLATSDEYDLTPVLNIIGRLGTHREKRSKHYHNQMTEKPQRRHYKSNCYKDNQRCCRHTMEVVFKEIKGFEFIIQPKAFDAGYCRGRCPPRYNPAHHHALLQSLIWKQDRTKVPRPCCAPSKLIELEVLHVDEKDNEKLKISTWTDMRVLECACS